MKRNLNLSTINQLLTFLCVLGLVIACTSVDETTPEKVASTEVTPVVVETKTPEPATEVSTLVSPVSPIQVEVTPPGPPPTIVVPKPAKDSGIVYGRLSHLDGTPFAKTNVRLGTIIWSPGQEGIDGFVAADKTSSPQTLTDDWGNFVIKDVPPGSYGLAVDNPELSGFTGYILNEAGDKILIIEVKAETVTNLEEIHFEFE